MEICRGQSHTSICQFEKADDPYLLLVTRKIAEFYNAPLRHRRRPSAVIPLGGFSVAEKHEWKNVVVSREVRLVQTSAQIPTLPTFVVFFLVPANELCVRMK
jgi:hypothetical protein